MRSLQLSALVAAAWTLTACGQQEVEAAPGADTAVQALSVDTLHALNDFELEVEGYAPFYREQERDGHPGVAINSIEYEDEFAAADHVWQGPSGTYDVTLGIRGEFDGEPTYILMLDETPVRLTVAPRTEIPITGPMPHTWEGIQIENGQTIRLAVNNTTNGLLPEGDGTGYARGRWSWLVLSRTQ